MNTRVRVSGIPYKINTKKFSKLLTNLLEINMNNVYIKMLSSSPFRTSNKDSVLTFTFARDAQLAQEKLNNFVYSYNKRLYILTAKYYYGSDYYKEDYTGGGLPLEKANKERLDLDRQIGILKEKKKLLEEEWKLLEEEQKLQEYKMKIQLPTTGDHSKNVLDTAQSSQSDSNVANKPPTCGTVKPCKVLVKKMSKFINRYSNSENREALLMKLCSTLKDRISMILCDQPRMQIPQIMELYRSHYPVSEDESLVKEMAQSLDESLWAEGESLSAELQMKSENAGNTTYSGTNTDKEKTDAKETNPKKDSVTGNNPAPAKQMYYFQASKVLLKRMNKVMDDNAEGERRKALVTLLRYRIKDRFAAAIAGRPIYQTYKVLQAYREVYPISGDDEFVKGLLKEIDENKWTIEDIKKMNNKWNKSDTVAENAGGAGENDTAQEEEMETSVEKKNEDESETVKKEEPEGNPETEDNSEGKNNAGENQTVSKSEADNSENNGNSVDKGSDEATNGQHSVNDSSEDPNCKSTQNITEDSMDDESRCAKRKCDTDDDSEAKLAKLWDGDFDVNDENSFEDWS